MLLGIVNNFLVPSFDSVSAIFDPVVPKFRVGLIVLERCLGRVTRHGNQLEPRVDDVHRIA